MKPECVRYGKTCQNMSVSDGPEIVLVQRNKRRPCLKACLRAESKRTKPEYDRYGKTCETMSVSDESESVFGTAEQPVTLSDGLEIVLVQRTTGDPI
jgi:hypothetical protein